MPLTVINRVIVDPSWRLVALTAVCAAGKHNVASRGSPERTDAGCHIDVVIRRATWATRGEKFLSCRPRGFDGWVERVVPPRLNASHSTEGRNPPVFSCFPQPKDPHLFRIKIPPADK